MISSAPTIDGEIVPGEWGEAAVAEPFSDGFNYSLEIDQTRAYLGYDQEYIYAAFECRDSQPDSIIAREIRQDATLSGEDTVTLVVDPYRTRRGDDGNYFSTNYLGTPNSYIAGGRAGKIEWKGEWLCAARKTVDGWSAEMRIPWRILTYPSQGRAVDMGLNFRRHQERTKIDSMWSNLGPERINLYAGDWQGVTLKKRAFQPRVSLLPFATANQQVVPEKRFIPGVGREKPLNVGLDARASVTQELTVVGTLNPDFSTVEGAIAGIDFTRGERFLPDPRPFFREGGDLYSVTVNPGRGWGNAFYSNRIQVFDAGLKAFGRLTQRDGIAVFGGTDLGDRRSDFLGRWNHEIGENATLGAYVVQRTLPGDTNTVFALNESIRRGSFLFRSEVTGSSGKDSGGMAAGTGVRWDQGRIRSGLSYTYIHPNFRAANGFVRFTDHTGPAFDLGYQNEWRTGVFRELNLFVSGDHQSHVDGRPFWKNLQGGAVLESRRDWLFRSSWELGEFEGRHDNEVSLGVVRNVSNRRDRLGLNYSFGTRADRPIQYIAPSLSRRLFGSWDVSVSSSLLSYREGSSLHVVSFNREFDPFRAFGGRVILRDGRMSYFVSYRVSGGRGAEIYVVVGDPTGSTGRARTSLITKVVFPVQL